MSNQVKNGMFDDYGKILETLQSESHRGGVLLGAAMLDDCLLKLLEGFMIEDANDEVARLLDNGSSAPLGTFSARSLSAFCLGLISEDEFKDIEIIRKIRNDFAHDLLEVSFDNQSIKDRCKNLTTPNILSKTVEMDASARFLIAVALLSSRLAVRALGVHKQQRKKAKPFTHSKRTTTDEDSSG